MSFQVNVLNNGNLSIKTTQPTDLEGLNAFLNLSKEKKKHVQILLNGTPITNPAESIEPKDKISVVLDDAYLMNDETPMYYAGVPVVYEDDWCLVANKKPFLLVHGDGNTEDTLTARVNSYLAQNGWPFAAQPVNRIDYEASGLVLFCKHPLVQSFFDRQMEDGTAKKEYLAVVEGRVNNREIDINNPIARNRHEAEKMMVYTKGKPAHTHITRLKLFNDKTLVKAEITTGRKHQIRVHLSNLGYPILNDPLYGIIRNNKGLMLQAYKLGFVQPFTNERIDVELDMDTRFKWFDPSLAKSE
ncbi:MAG: RluA family pseudouridine synthase [Ileibacterium sp.]|nr:RluA family pseudouridine synthase [Ileibacterium sp.]